MNTLKIALVSLMVVSFISGCARQQSSTEGAEGYNSIEVDGLTRTYIAHVPPSYDEMTPTPLVLVLHGGGGSAQKMVNFTGFNTLSDQEGFIVVYPNGVENHWNDGRGVHKYRAHRENIDDVTFISALIDRLTQEYTIDETRIYATGISNGAMMSCRLACELSERIAAIAMVAGAMSEELSAACSPSRPVSVLVMSGTDDPLVLWEGGNIQFGRQNLGTTLSVPDTVMYWVTHNNCSLTPAVTWLPDTQEDGTQVRKEVYNRGKEGTEVILYAIEGGGHTWPGGLQYASKRLIGRTCYDITATEIIWQFFSEHTRE
ncbi:MAG: phospholipase [Theionarchaea archaeon]|nr:MAG: hypothetical protein AYK19_02040 [Theionarchaea archaeon DG-70-1]MBU7028057.1 phospholipase [Theionarchaea archaeon]